MQKRHVITTVIVSAALSVGGVTAAYASTSSGGSAPAVTSGSSKTTTAHSGRHAAKKHRPLTARALHVTWVTGASKKTEGKSVTHDAVRGIVTSASASSVTVRAKDGFSQTYAIDDKTKVRERKGHQVAQSSASKITKGMHARVIGIGSVSSPTATHIRFSPAAQKDDKSS